MESNTPRLRWSIYGIHVFNHYRFAFQIDWCSASKTIEKLRIVFATYELPRKVITDNGPTFTSSEFRQFMEGNRIKHSTTSPYHPSSNGLAERVIQVIKQALRSGKGGNVQEILSKFLFMYHITPHTTTGVPPSELLMGCCLRSRLDLFSRS